MAKAKKKVENPVEEARYYDILRQPLITEKSTMASEHGKTVFYVPMDATKNDVKAAVEGLFGVTVEKVNTMTVNGKVKRFRGRLGTRPNRKKAVVTLKAGDTLDIMATA